MVEPRPLDRSRSLWGRDLRHAAIVVLDRSGASTVGQILGALEQAGFTVLAPAGQPANKVLADALGHEVVRGRVTRIRRGAYEVSHLPTTTAWRLRKRWAG